MKILFLSIIIKKLQVHKKSISWVWAKHGFGKIFFKRDGVTSLLWAKHGFGKIFFKRDGVTSLLWAKHGFGKIFLKLTLSDVTTLSWKLNKLNADMFMCFSIIRKYLSRVMGELKLKMTQFFSFLCNLKLNSHLPKRFLFASMKAL